MAKLRPVLFPYFGGKRLVAPIVWQAIGDVKHYIEPFFGSGAVLLNRPNYDPTRHIESINDKDGFVANAWRAIKFAPDEVLKWCDWPVNHADLVARNKFLLSVDGAFLERLMDDESWYDPKIAGYWIYVLSSSISPRVEDSHRIPRLSDAGTGVHKLDFRSNSIPNLANSGKGPHKISFRQPNALYDFMHWLSDRLRHVRVVCGDWTRLCSDRRKDRLVPVGVFLDPPYGVKNRDRVYTVDSTTIAHDVRKWALERGQKETYRIVLAGYEEHDELLKHGWTLYRWKANGGFGNQKRQTRNNNHTRECLYFSPHCLKV